MAQPDLSRRIGTTVADTGVPGWRFDSLRLASADAQRHYHIRIAIPDIPAPERGFPVVYLLDGNAALMDVDASLLDELLKAPNPPVLAFIGYDSDLRIDTVARAFDYTPRHPDGQQTQTERSQNIRPSGGADAFLELIQRGIKPEVEAIACIDRQRQWLWGHSFGGLFALHVLATRPAAFNGIAVADPSLWWGDGFILRELDALPVQDLDKAHPRQVLMFVGTGQQRRRSLPRPESDATQPSTGPRTDRRAAVSPDAAASLATRLSALPGMQASHYTLEGLSHGQTLGASLAPTLRHVANGSVTP